MSIEERNPLELSDEEMMDMPEPVIIPEDEPEDVVEEPTEEPEEEEDDEDDTTDEENEDDAAPNEDEQDAEEEEPSPEENVEEPTEEKDEVDPDLDTKAETTKKSEEEVDKTLDYEAEYKKLLTPFKASGREVNISNVDEAIQLMQMGADYNKKMAGLKPSLKLLKMLENNELLNEDKISYLIDLDKKNPEAITKLIKESGIDPLEVDVSADTEYKPNTYTVDDRQVELDGILADIEHTDSYANTIDIISNKWDESSKRALYDNPADIKSINDQLSSGVYAQIDTVVQNQKMLGNLKGLSDIEAYKQVGAYMQQNGLFQGQTPLAPAANVATPTASTTQSPKLKNRKKAAGSTKAAPKKSKAQSDFNPLSLSDEEFAKVSTPQI